ncbi:MAG: rhodanese-like domain-containing protein [Kiritimatiellae bacterium]|nr:rhodanese-like domain-containing protein [Kiritimatiellia bacterium]
MKKLTLITLETLMEMKENKEAFTLVDTLSGESYHEGHIPGAINIPVDKIDQLAPTLLDKRATIVTYCGGYACTASTRAARTLLDLGYKHTLDFKAGKKGWQDAGLEMEK